MDPAGSTGPHRATDVASLRWEVFAPEADDVLAAIALCRKAGIGFWDAMILHSATELGCDVVWSEDLNAGSLTPALSCAVRSSPRAELGGVPAPTGVRPNTSDAV